MLRVFYPDYYVEDVFSINYEKLMEMGFKALILDIDNTLVPHGDDSTQAVDELFHRLHSMGWKTLLLSNNNKARIERFKAHFDTLYIEEAGKPQPASYHRAVTMLGVEPSQVMVIGDQVFTDVIAGRLAPVYTIMVEKYSSKEIWYVVLKRPFEKLVRLIGRF